MKDICRYLSVSHGLVVLTVKEAPDVAPRPRGRPHSNVPPPPTPRQILGDDYIPEYLTESQKTRFILKLPGQPLHHPRATRRVQRPRPDAVDKDPRVPIESEVAIRLDTPTPDQASTIRERIARVSSRVDA